MSKLDYLLLFLIIAIPISAVYFAISWMLEHGPKIAEFAGKVAK